MSKFSLENAQRLSIVICMLIVSLSTIYFISIYLPHKDYLTASKECVEFGNALEKTREKDSMDNTVHFGNAKFNKKLNSCLYKGDTIFVDTNETMASVRDVYQNISLLNYTGMKVAKNQCITSATVACDYNDFLKRAEVIMNN